MVKVKNVLVDPANHTRKSLAMPNKRFGGGGGRGRSAGAKKFNAAAACSVHSVYLIKAVGKNGLAKPCFQMCVLRTVFLTTYFDVQTQPVGEGHNGGGGGGGGHDVPAGADAAGAAAKAPKAAPSESPSEIPAAKVNASSVHRFFNNRVFRCVMKTVFLTTYFDVQTQPVVECPRDIGGGGGGGGLKELRGDDAAGAAAKAALAGNAAGAKSDNLGLTSSEDEEARPVRSIRTIRKLINIALDTDSSGSSTGNLASLLSEYSAARKQNSSSALKKLEATNSVPAEHCRPPVR